MNLDASVSKLLDNSWYIVLYKNALGSITAEASIEGAASSNVVVTDDFTPTKAMYRLTEKVFGNIVGAEVDMP